MGEVIAFDPIDYDAEAIPPDLPDGAWQGLLSAEIRASSKGQPQIVVTYEVTVAYDEQYESFVGQTVKEYLTFIPGDTRGAKMSKINLKAFCEHLKIDRGIIPKHIGSSEDLAELASLIEGQTVDFWSRIEKGIDKRTGEETENVRILHKAPKSAGDTGVLAPAEDPEDATGDPDATEDEGDVEAAAADPEPEPVPEPVTGTRAKGAANGTATKNGAAATAKKGTKPQAASARR